MVRKKNKLLIGLLFSLAMNLILIYFIRDKIANKYKQYFCEIPYNPKSRPDYWCIQGWNNTLKKMDINCDVCFSVTQLYMEVISENTSRTNP